MHARQPDGHMDERGHEKSRRHDGDGHEPVIIQTFEAHGHAGDRKDPPAGQNRCRQDAFGNMHAAILDGRGGTVSPPLPVTCRRHSSGRPSATFSWRAWGPRTWSTARRRAQPSWPCHPSRWSGAHRTGRRSPTSRQTARHTRTHRWRRS